MSSIKYSIFIVALLFVFVITGCTVRTYKVTKDRIDQEISGNRGYLSGEGPTIEGQPRSKTRETVVVEVEFSSPWSQKTAKPEVKQEPEKNYITQPSEVYEEGILAEESEIMAQEEEITYTAYEIMKDDTLQKISNKFYGTNRKWKKIYEVNKDVIKDPNRIKPGVIINIPQE
ncbi:MAG: LysM peptidoglycan-binding domain-containing protein [Candidatus Omnitrophota bacterium]